VDEFSPLLGKNGWELATLLFKKKKKPAFLESIEKNSRGRKLE